MDVYIAEEKLFIQVELAGMRRADLELMVEGNRLMISVALSYGVGRRNEIFSDGNQLRAV